MKLLLENWRQYLAEEQSESIFGYTIQPDDKVFLSNTPFDEMRTIQSGQQQKEGYKPLGLWYGCGDGWLRYASQELPSDYMADVKYIYKIELNYAEKLEDSPYDRVLKVDTVEDLSSLSMEYGVTDRYGYTKLNWRRFSNDYGGIEICPYQGYKHNPETDRNIRMSPDYDWYYPWDVASGCVWDAGAIRNIELLASKESV
jgi:hypothetical protein